jgi:hypothetical protein
MKDTGRMIKDNENVIMKGEMEMYMKETLRMV